MKARGSLNKQGRPHNFIFYIGYLYTWTKINTIAKQKPVTKLVYVLSDELEG